MKKNENTREKISLKTPQAPGFEEVDRTTEALLNMLEDTEESRKKIEKEKNKTLAIINQLTDGLIVLDKEDKIVLINPKAEELLGLKRKETEGKSFNILIEGFSLGDISKLLRAREEKRLFREEISLEKPKELVLELSEVFLDPEEESIIVLHNISREKLIEKMKTEFVSISAHQLRTPLSAIKWTLRMLLDGDLGKITEEQRRLIEKTYQSNERMILLINDLLDVTRIEEGRYLFKPVLAQIEDLTQTVIDSFKEKINRKQIKFIFKKVEKKLPKVKVDVDKIKVAIDNFIDNAINYTPPRGKITVSLERTKEEMKFIIKDNGVGIPQNQQKRVFSRFFRGTNVMRMETEGTGLGLFITKNIIEAHGGRVWFKSKERKGSTFYFTLPLKKEFERFIEGF